MIFVRDFQWSLRNISHIARHGVAPEEIVQVCQTKHITRNTYNERLLIIGKTAHSRIIAIVLEKLPKGVYFPVTARPASRKERKEYLKFIEGGDY